MEYEAQVSNRDKWIISAIAGLIFLVIGSPYVYRLVDGLTKRIGFRTANKEGLPTTMGLVLHAVVYALIVRALMMDKH